MGTEEKKCPMSFNSLHNAASDCCEKQCAWWCEYNDETQKWSECAIKALSRIYDLPTV